MVQVIYISDWTPLLRLMLWKPSTERNRLLGGWKSGMQHGKRNMNLYNVSSWMCYQCKLQVPKDLKSGEGFNKGDSPGLSMQILDAKAEVIWDLKSNFDKKDLALRKRMWFHPEDICSLKRELRLSQKPRPVWPYLWYPWRKLYFCTKHNCF